MAEGDDLVLVTGATGYVAQHCVDQLLRRGYRVRGTVRPAVPADAVRVPFQAIADADRRIEVVAADLTRDDGWDEALKGCRYVLHVAAPFPMVPPRVRDGLLAPARDGTLRVLRAASRAGVERTVVTSSTVAVLHGHPGASDRVFDQSDWTDTDSPTITSYAYAKTLAERSAWDFAAADRSGMTLATVNPGLILGPIIDSHLPTSVEILRYLLTGKYPAVPRVGFPVVDVRDVAVAHIAAMETAAAAGQRYIAAAGSLWIADIARLLRQAFPERARRIPRRELPDLIVRVVALFDPSLRAVLPDLGRLFRVSTDKARRELGLSWRDLGDTVRDTAQSLIDRGIV